jgi:hypothetical protein
MRVVKVEKIATGDTLVTLANGRKFVSGEYRRQGFTSLKDWYVLPSLRKVSGFTGLAIEAALDRRDKAAAEEAKREKLRRHMTTEQLTVTTTPPSTMDKAIVVSFILTIVNLGLIRLLVAILDGS